MRGAGQSRPVNVTIVVPCYNEEKRLDATLFRSFDTAVRFLFVDDGSRDNTRQLLSQLVEGRPNLRAMSLEKNSGKAEAVRRGLLDAMSEGAEIVGFWDADLATPLSEIPRFLEIFHEKSDVDLVFGSRVKLMGRDIQRRAIRHYLGRIAATAISNVLDLAIYDTQCGAKMFRVDDDARAVFAEPFSTRWIFDVEILARYIVRARERGETILDRVYELPLMHWRDVAGSNVRASDFGRAGRDLWKIKRRYF